MSKRSQRRSAAARSASAGHSQDGPNSGWAGGIPFSTDALNDAAKDFNEQTWEQMDDVDRVKGLPPRKRITGDHPSVRKRKPPIETLIASNDFSDEGPQSSAAGWVAARNPGAPDSTPSPPSRHPPVVPVEMPDLRLTLLAGWNTPAWRAAARERARRLNAGDDMASWSYIDWEVEALNKAELWWVGPEMVDLVVTAIPKVPADVQPDHLTIPSLYGMVVLAKPWLGTDSFTGAETVQTDAVVWGPQNVQGQQCMSISMYRCLRWEDGVGPQDLKLAADLGLIDQAKRHVTVDPATGKAAYILTGKAWMPLGRSEWPYANRIDEPIELDSGGTIVVPAALPKHARSDDDAAFAASNEEDRRFIASLFTWLATKSVAETISEPVSRPARKRQQRAGVELPERNVKCVYLRRPEKEHGEHTQGDGHHAQWSHRWIVSAHMRNQPYGPGRTARKLIMIPAHVKGPDGLPVVVKETVRVWIR